jgi:hydroxyacylglutathione hydrolase
MPSVIQSICLRLPYNIGSVNCFLIKSDNGFVLIDTGASSGRTDLEKAMSDAGCLPGELKLILLTHGDFDHTGNAAVIRKEFDAPIAMHAADAGMAEWGNMFVNRKRSNPLLNFLAGTMFGFGKSKRFKPDLLVDEDFDLSTYGLEAQILHIPGHSSGSIGVLTSDGDLICGDLFENIKGPALNSLMDDLKDASASVEKLKGYKIDRVFPGHGQPFAMEEFLAEWGKS